ncbi:hypothetical protein RO967_03795 [Lactiplantibacillus plantarum]|nr:hypothetical protein [Lactiplantibacillus plantarum]
MLKSELNRYIHDWRTRIFAILIVVIPLLDFIQVLFSQDFADFGDAQYRFNPIVASFLSGSQAEHYGQIIFVWFMPILLLGLCADRPIRDHKEQYDIAQIMRLEKKTILFGWFNGQWNPYFCDNWDWTNTQLSTGVVSFSWR